MDAATLVTRLVDAHNAHDYQSLLAAYAFGANVHFACWQEPVDAGTWVAAQASIRESFPDIRFRTGAVATGPGVAVVELTMAATNTGVLYLGDDDRIVLRTDAQSLPATGRRMMIGGVVVLEVSGGLVTAERHFWPTVQSLVQLRLVRPRYPADEFAGTTG